MDFTNVDLHLHSTASDGTDSPVEIVKKIREKGIKIPQSYCCERTQFISLHRIRENVLYNRLVSLIDLRLR